MAELHIVKIGGDIIDDEQRLGIFLNNFALLPNLKILVHGGGKMVSDLAKKLSISVKMRDGRRITDAHTLDLTIMVYAGIINKKIVAQLQSQSCPALGLSGADGGVIIARKRPAGPVDYGFVGDIDTVNTEFIKKILFQKLTPVFCALTVDQQGQLLNTNADTIASELAITLSFSFQTKLTYIIKEFGVLEDISNKYSLITGLSESKFSELINNRKISGGMLPKLHTGFRARTHGVNRIQITNFTKLTDPNSGTILI